jgi:hypothetical protein
LPVVDSVFDEEDAFELELARTIRESLVADTGRGSSYAH